MGFVVLLLSSTEGWGLPPCQGPTYNWTNCIGSWSNGWFKYTGEWKDGNPHGQGTETFPNRDKYVGEYKDGKKHGQGTYTFANGNKYVGEWREGKQNGQGTLTYSDGRKYVGQWKNGKPHGQGTDTLANGAKIVGEFKDGKPWNGTVHYKDGTAIATFSDGVMTEK